MVYQKLFTHELNRSSVEDFKQIPKLPIILLADSLRSGHNVGALFRIADAFRFEAVALSGYTVRPPHSEIHKTAIGATESVHWIDVLDVFDFIRKYKEKNYKIVAVEQTKESMSLVDFPVDLNSKYIIILGNEVEGIHQQLLNECQYCLEIPQEGTKHSLNVSVAAGIVAWNFYCKIKP